MILSLPYKRAAFTSLAYTVLAFSITSPANAQVEVTPYIVNGSTANVADYPSFVSLYLGGQEYGVGYSSSPYCGGTLLNSEYVLTAAHCVYGNSDSQLLTMAAPNLQYESDYVNSEKRRVVEIFYPSDYVDDINKLLPNDIAILKLESALGVGTAINRPNNESYRNPASVFTAVGHGNTSYGHDAFDVLQKVNLTFVNNTVCAGAFSDGSHLSPEKQICFTGDYSNATKLLAGTCQGDSGGPIYWDNNGQQVQVGVTSFGPVPCGDKNRSVTAVFTEIADYSDWINRVLNGQEVAKHVSNDTARRNYLISKGYNIGSSGNNGSSSSSSSGSGGGGAVHFSFVALLVGLGWMRRQKTIQV